MITLGVESTAHTFGISLIKDSQILCNLKNVFTTEQGGLIPNEVAGHHNKIKEELLEKALQETNLKITDINIIGVSTAPGLAPCLLVGLAFTKKLSKELNIPLIPVNHCIAHLEIGKSFTKATDPILLYASGANTQIIAYEGKKYRIFGETLDLGIGNFIDTIARGFNLGFPGGPKIEELAKKSKNYITLPYNVKGMDISLSGIQTNIISKINKEKIEDLCYSLQETVFAMLVEITERAMAHCNKNELILGGGVACNKRLQEMCLEMCRERNAKLFLLENQYLVDNAAMIAITAEKMFKVKKIYKEIDIYPKQRTDQVEIFW
ncbi:tRNA (adenosine(37)-N6)-threonylcarbamoyltransferase complex transferase subunit TsaD [Candidatus Woesearchaeota archaeon]|nr:tRNA (adenosine(37)-N6)-threonylcarbamoyltransferase complex transferase subunit TsaD [Candidatus Woesearchaeota archaeon]